MIFHRNRPLFILRYESSRAFPQHLEKTIYHLPETERTVFSHYEKWDSIDYESGNSRNGYYSCNLKIICDTLELPIPRDRLGEFNLRTISPHKQRAEDLEQTIIRFYQKIITTREIADLIEKIYGHHYSATTVFNIVGFSKKI